MNEKSSVIFEADELYDQSRRAERVLDYVIEGDVAAEAESTEVDSTEVRRSSQVLDVVDMRATSRVLFVTQDTDVFTEGSSAQQAYVGLEQSFDEVHVLVLVRRKGKETSVRLSDRTWAYAACDLRWWRVPFRARSRAEELLVFNGSIRPDVVVAVEPYEAGVAAYLIAKRFDRPLQVHVSENFLSDAFVSRAKHNKWRRRMARFVLKRTKSVRTATSAVKEVIEKRFRNVADLEVLPKFYNFSGYLNAQPAFDVHDKYRDFTFIALAFGELTATSNLHTTFTALNRYLHNARMGLIVVGNGPAKHLFEEKVALLGVKERVVFVTTSADPVSLMKTADVLIETGTTPDSEETIMRAAAAGIPIVATHSELRDDLFVNGESAYLCAADDPHCIGQKLMKLLNTPAIRRQFSLQVREVARDRLIEDPAAYYRAYRDTVEVALGPDQTPAAEEQVHERAHMQQAVPAAS
ncbi:MAG: glycosyltransferase [Candidatus Paceibacterota bacterium]